MSDFALPSLSWNIISLSFVYNSFIHISTQICRFPSEDMFPYPLFPQSQYILLSHYLYSSYQLLKLIHYLVVFFYTLWNVSKLFENLLLLPIL
jgi:hypothetical protein